MSIIEKNLTGLLRLCKKTLLQLKAVILEVACENLSKLLIFFSIPFYLFFRSGQIINFALKYKIWIG